MDGRHVIDTARFEIGFRSEEEAFSRQDDLDGLIKRHLMPIVDSIFEELAPKDDVIKLDTLEIDLGEVHFSELEQAFERGLRDGLGAALAEAAQENSSGRRVTKRRAELEQWQFYLIHGRFPWDADLSDLDSIDQWLARILDSQGAAFVGLLRRASSTGETVRRLVIQFPDELLGKLVSQVSVGHGRLAVELLDELRRSWQRSGLRQGDARGLRDRLWAGLIEALLVEGGPQPSPAEWVRRGIDHSALSPMAVEPEVFAVLLGEADDIERRLELGTALTDDLRRMQVGQQGEPSASTPESLHGERLTASGEAANVDVAEPIEQPATGSEPLDRFESEAISRQIVRAYDLFDTLRDALIGEVSDSEHVGDLLGVIDELIRDHPWQMLRLYRTLQAGAPSRDYGLARLPAALLHHLIKGFVALTVGEERAEQSDLLRAVDIYAGRVVDRQRYYARVLQVLLRHELLDLEEMVAEVDVAVESGELGPVAQDAAESKPVELGDFSRLRAAPKHAVEPVPGLSRSALRRRVKRALDALSRGPDSRSEAMRARLIQGLTHAIDSDPDWLGRLLETRLRDADTVGRICEALPERLMTRVLLLLRPRDHHRLQHAADMIAQACYSGDIGAAPEQIDQLKWRYVFDRFLGRSGIPDERAFVEGLVAYLARELRSGGEAGLRSLVSQRLALDSLPSTRGRYARIRAAFGPQRDSSLPGAPVTSRPQIPAPSTAPRELDGEVAEHGYVDNAGIVLAAPYLPRLFHKLGLIGDLGFRDRAAAERAVHLIQYLVDGRSDTPEYRLSLNKVLCGIEPHVPVPRRITLTETERKLTTGLLRAMVQNWKAIGNTSVPGLRESFLQRAGRLQLRDDMWCLLVEQRAYDLLLDRLPWSYSMIKYSWMRRALQVDWR